MKYLYILEDQTLEQKDDIAPTAEDLQAVSDGLLIIIRWNNGSFEEVNEDGVWEEIP